MKHNVKVFLLFIAPIFMCGCSRVSGKLLIMEANYRNSRGMYNEAVSSYLKALEYGEAAPYAEFGLGTVYNTLGEGKAALDRFAGARRMAEAFPPAVHRELRYRIHYNTGVVLFSEGDFSGAADSFREALRIDGGKIAAKRNLELSIRSLAREKISSGGGDGAEENESMALLFEYIRQKELNQWRSREWPEENDIAEPDY